jgi:hypothetical protein
VVAGAGADRAHQEFEPRALGHRLEVAASSSMGPGLKLDVAEVASV